MVTLWQVSNATATFVSYKKAAMGSLYIRANQVWHKTQLLQSSGKDFKATFIKIIVIKNNDIKMFNKEMEIMELQKQ